MKVFSIVVLAVLVSACFFGMGWNMAKMQVLRHIRKMLDANQESPITPDATIRKLGWLTALNHVMDVL